MILTAAEIQAQTVLIELEDPIETPNNNFYQFYPKSIEEAATYKLTYQMDLTINLQPPADITANVTSDGIKLAWNPPPPVTVPHHYSDNVLYYKIFRRSENTRFEFLTQTIENS